MMTSHTDPSRNPITGDKLQTKPSTKEYRDGWDAIFGKAEKLMDEKCCGKCSPCSGHDKEQENDREVQESK